MKCIFSLLMLCFLLFASMRPEKVNTSNDRYMSVADLVNTGKVDVKFTGCGYYMGHTMQMNVKNTTGDTVFLFVEPGRRLVASDSTYQDIFVVKSKRMQLPPYGELKDSLYGFCCQAHDHVPAKGLAFDVGFMAPDPWIKLARVIDANDFPMTAIQASVWILSDGILPASLYDEDPKKIYLLKKTLGEILGIEMPWYAIEYEKDSTRIFSSRPLRVSGSFSYTLRTNAMISITVRNASGRFLKTLVSNSPAGPGTHTYDLDLPVKKWPKGKYAIYVQEDNANLNLRKSFEL